MNKEEELVKVGIIENIFEAKDIIKEVREKIVNETDKR